MKLVSGMIVEEVGKEEDESILSEEVINENISEMKMEKVGEEEEKVGEEEEVGEEEDEDIELDNSFLEDSFLEESFENPDKEEKGLNF